MSAKKQAASVALGLVLGFALPQITHAQITVQTLSALQRAELDRQIADKQKSLVDSAKPPAPPAPDPALLKKLPDALLTLAPPAPPPPPPKKVLAIYGHPGSEKVEISLPDGSIVAATPGQAQPGGWQLVSVNKNQVVVEITKPVSKKAAKGTKGTKGSKSDKAQAAPTKTTRTLSVGGTF